MSVLLDFNIAVGLAILVHAMCVINTMDRSTDHLFRLGYVTLGVGALAVVLGPVYGYSHPPPAETLVNIGAALALIVGTWRRRGGSYGQALQLLWSACARLVSRFSRKAK